MAITTVTKPPDTDSTAAVDLEAAHRVYDEVKRAIGRSVDPSGDPVCLAATIRKVAAEFTEEAQKQGVVLSEDDYAELAEAVMKAELASHIRIWLSRIFGQSEQSTVSSGMFAVRHKAGSGV